MLVGYNNNVTYKGKVYHVQTEDCGLSNPVIVTLLYYKGTILASKKISYSHLIESKDLKENVRELMKTQHKTMLKELVAGKYTGDVQEVVSEAAAEKAAEAVVSEIKEEAQADKTLDDILLDYIMKREKSK